MKAIIVCGSREWGDSHLICKTLEAAKPNLVIHGDCRGADRIAGNWATNSDIASVLAIPAQWKTHGRSAGPRRNAEMLGALLEFRDRGYDVAVHAFLLPTSRGTRDMLAKARAAGVATHEHRGEP